MINITKSVLFSKLSSTHRMKYITIMFDIPPVKFNQCRGSYDGVCIVLKKACTIACPASGCTGFYTLRFIVNVS